MLRPAWEPPLKRTAAAVEEVAFARSYERSPRPYEDPPATAFLAKNRPAPTAQALVAAVEEPLADRQHLRAAAPEQACLVVDPWDPHSAQTDSQTSRTTNSLGPVEVVLCSHAHFDHYDGTTTCWNEDNPAVWTLDQVAGPVAEPFRLKTPFLGGNRAVTRQLRDSEQARQREEVRAEVSALPGQTLFTMDVETTIDGKRACSPPTTSPATLYSGTGGWMGLNRSGPATCRPALSAGIAPDWVLAEHGSAWSSTPPTSAAASMGPTRRTADAARPSAATADWNPHHVRVEPVLLKGRARRDVDWRAGGRERAEPQANPDGHPRRPRRDEGSNVDGRGGPRATTRRPIQAHPRRRRCREAGMSLC
ncbi:MAG: hypothetical protein U0797_09060 [Gemmataceae bacterium]